MAVFLIGAGVLVWKAQASPLSTGAATATTVYGGVAAIAPDSSSDVMEIGNSGSDIASSGDLYLRPSNLAGTQGVRFTKNVSGQTDVHAIGGLCLNGVCRDTWPVTGGTSYWSLVSNQYLQPVTITQGLSITAPDWNDAALKVYGNSLQAAAYIENNSADSNALAVLIDDGLNTINGDLNVSTGISVTHGQCQGGASNGRLCYSDNDCYDGATHICAPTEFPVWHAGNDGRGSGLDATYLDGEPLHFQYNRGTGSCGSGRYCLCDTDTYTCIELQ